MRVLKSFLAEIVILLFVATGAAFAGGQTEVKPSPSAPSGPIPSLAALYKPYFPIGAAVGDQLLDQEGPFIASQFDSLVAANDMKWAIIHPVPGNKPADYNFAQADAIVAFAQKHGMLVRGHNFVWHQQVPDWVFEGADGRPLSATKAEVLARLKEHITTLIDHFRGKVYCWDVVNEALSDGDHVWREDSPWYKTAGTSSKGDDGVPDYIIKAYEYARQADPNVKLFYNDYNIESGPKFEHALQLARILKAKGLLDGIGIQGHWQIQSVDPEAVRHAIDSFAALGLQVQITELDLSVYRWGDDSSLSSLPADREALQTKDYGELFKVFREEGAAGKLTGVTFWGVTDADTWLNNFPVGGRTDWPLLFDAKLRPKPAFWAVAKW